MLQLHCCKAVAHMRAQHHARGVRVVVVVGGGVCVSVLSRVWGVGGARSVAEPRLRCSSRWAIRTFHSSYNNAKMMKCWVDDLALEAMEESPEPSTKGTRGKIRGNTPPAHTPTWTRTTDTHTHTHTHTHLEGGHVVGRTGFVLRACVEVEVVLGGGAAAHAGIHPPSWRRLLAAHAPCGSRAAHTFANASCARR